MAWDEWEQLKTEAAASRSTEMELNQLPTAPGSGGRGGDSGSHDLVVEKDHLGAVGHDAFVLHGKLQKQGDIAGTGINKDGAGSSMQAAASLKSHNFSTGELLASAVEMWTSQSKALLQACAHISNHLDYSNRLHAEQDALIGAELRGRNGLAVPVSRLNDYFK